MIMINFLRNFTNFLENTFYKSFAFLPKKRTGLPANLFINDGGSSNKNEKNYKIKFQNNKNIAADYKKTSTMKISDNPEILRNFKKSSLCQSEITEIKNFVINNKDSLIKLSNQEIDIFDFILEMHY